jgi:hypothetical protein
MKGDVATMSSISEFEPGAAGGGKSPATISWETPRGITPGFNLALFAFSAFLGLFQFLFLSDRARDYPAAALVLSSTLDLARFAVVALITAAFVREFWRRLIAQIAPVRPIDFQEALAIVLMAAILLGT